MKLDFYQLGSGPANVIILHGLFGSSHNFRTLAKKLSEVYRVYCLDLRNHGNSPHSRVVSLEAMAADIIEFIIEYNIKSPAILGHSLGGKVAMQVALNYPKCLSKLIIGDIAPMVYPHHHDRIFAGLNEVSRRGPDTRKAAEQILADYVDSAEVRLFLLTNLVRDHTLSWRINVAGLQNGYSHIAAKPYGIAYDGPALFIRGALSDYIREQYYPAIYQLFPKADIVTLEGTGHWLHAEKPDEFAKIILNFL